MRLPLAPTPRGWGLLVGAAVLAVARPLIGLRDIWFPAAVLAALVVVSLLTAGVWGIAARFRVTVTVLDPTPTVGDEIVATATVSHRLAFAQSVELTWSIDGGRSQTRALAGARVESRSSLSMVSGHRGRKRVRLREVRFGDPLGLAVWRSAVDASAEVVVLPRPLVGMDMAFWATRSPRDPAEPAGAGRIGGSGPPEGALREYQTGDAMRQVHWKQSARQGELLVNLSAADTASQLSVLLDTSRQAYPTTSSFERAVSAVAAIGRAALQRGRHVRLAVGGERPAVMTTLPGLLHALAVAETRDDEAVTADGTEHARGDTVVTGRVTPALLAKLDGGRPGALVTTASAGASLAPAHWVVLSAPAEPSRKGGAS